MPARPALVLRLSDHLTIDSLGDMLQPVDAWLARAEGVWPLVVDCSHMTGYENDARLLFLAWVSRVRLRISRLAIVVQAPVWRVIASAAAFVEERDMQAFSDVAEAEMWACEREGALA